MKSQSLSCMCALAMAGACLLLTSPLASAGVIAQDSFDDYPVGSLAGQNSGSGWAGAWTAGAGNTGNVADTTGNSLSFDVAGGATISGNTRAVELFGTANAIVATRQFATPLPDSFYVACLVRVAAGNWTDTDTFGIHLANTAGNAGSSLNFGLRGPNITVVRTGTGTPVAGATAAGSTALGTTSYLVARVSKLDGSGNASSGYDRIELWVNPGLGDDFNKPTGDARLQLTGTGLTTISYALVRIAALESGDQVQVDQLIIADTWSDVINPNSASTISGVAPADGTLFWPSTNGFNFQATSSEPLEPADLRLLLNGVDVSANLVISGEPTSRSVIYGGLLENMQYTAQISVSNAAGVSSATVRFDTFSTLTAVVIEAEDYNYDVWGECTRPWPGVNGYVGGTYMNNPPPSGFDLSTGFKIGGSQGDGTYLGYVDAFGVVDVDYHDARSAESPGGGAFRYCDPIGNRVSSDARRSQYVAANLPEYEVYEVGVGDWMNYTRDFAPSFYKAYLRVASPKAATVQLGKVTGDRTTMEQAVTPAGVFLIPNTGGAGRYAYVPMTDGSGQTEVTVTLGGTDTVRLTGLNVASNEFLNFLVLVPVGASLQPPTVRIDSPINGTVFPAHADIAVILDAQDADGSISQVTVKAMSLGSTNVIATFTHSPYAFTWSNVADGVYTLTAEATDNDGLKGLSSPVQLIVGNPPPPSLLVVGESPMSAGDSEVFNRMALLGLQVVVQLATATTSADGDGKQLIVISSSVLSGDVGTKFTASTTPVIQWEQALVDEFLISSAGSLLGGQREIVITDAGAAHPLGAGLPAGTNLVRTTATQVHLASDVNLAPGAVVIARAANDTNTSPAIVGVDTGGTLNNGSPAPARRVNMFWGDSGLSNVNAAGLALFDAAVNWAIGRNAPGPALRITATAGQVIVSWPASTTGEVLQENTEAANSAGWISTSRTIDNNGTTKSVTIAAPTGNVFFRLIK